ncbi:MAG: hypothetical protein ACK5V3_16330, partial [Bdellovibrionales bacterium]
HKSEKHQEVALDQDQHFQKVYEKNERDNQQALEIQDQRFTKQVINQKRKLARDLDKYAGKEHDPFYKIQDRGSRFSESSEAYIIKAYVPEHEKDSVRVAVDKNKAVISGQRKFNDKIEDEIRKVSTDNYQSFREEFKFDRPVITEAMDRDRQGDYIIFRIPKL